MPGTTDLKRAIKLKELDYTMFMYATQSRNTDETISEFKERMLYLLEQFRELTALGGTTDPSDLQLTTFTHNARL